LRIQNAFASLSQVAVEDALSPHVEFVSASHGGVYEAQAHKVVWTFASLPQGETLLILKVRVRANTPDDSLVANTFLL
ncbi:hypothetical protein Q0M30_19360, partial [Staphylococcus aureus]|nr:hypothetical protein [Staphylococcus aureus]